VPNVDPAIAKALAGIDEARALRKGIVAKVARLKDAVAEAEAKVGLASLLAEGPDPTGEGSRTCHKLARQSLQSIRVLNSHATF
jgi:hypothetical protein